MTNSQPHLSQPTKKQLKFLRDLAIGRGQTFAVPDTFAEADKEIKRLLGARRTSLADRRSETRAIREEMASQRGNAASVRPDELGGYGSSAGWA
jgi:hypothetical protein